VLGTPPTKGRNISNAFNTVPVSVLDTLVHPFFDELRDPLMHVSFLPPVFNFKPHELKGVRVPVEIMAKLVPEHAEEAGSMAGFVILSAARFKISGNRLSASWKGSNWCIDRLVTSQIQSGLNS
ncbi:hypothetical protein HID58_063264, partial [Brassica napus]